MKRTILRRSKILVEHALNFIKLRCISLELKNTELVPFVQPVFRGQSLIGCEVLLRFNKNGCIYPPEPLITEIETTHLINKVTCDLLQQVKAHFSLCRESLPEGFFFSFNICVHQLTSKDVISAINDFHTQFKGSAELHLEIVERGTCLIDDITLDEMGKLANSGVKFSVDDFGSGSASLKYINNACFSTVKIDKSLTIMCRDILVYADIIESIVSLSRKLNVQVIAEGVESDEQLKLLQRAGVKYFQGFWFSKPVAMNELFK